MARKKGSTKAQKEERLLKIATMIAAGVPVTSIVSTLSEEWELSAHRVRELLREVDERALQQRRRDAPYIRERLLRKAERCYAKCIADGKHGAAVQMLIAEIKATAALEAEDPEVEELLHNLGPPPKEAELTHAWLLQAMTINLYGIQRSRAIEPLTRFRLGADLGAKISLMGDKAQIQESIRLLSAEVERLSRLVLKEAGHGAVTPGPAGLPEKGAGQ